MASDAEEFAMKQILFPGRAAPGPGPGLQLAGWHPGPPGPPQSGRRGAACV